MGRYVPFVLVCLATLLGATYLPRHPCCGSWLPVVERLTLLGIYDLIQRSHSVRRNYPIIGLLRWLFESIRPEIRQYLIEGDNEQSPFSRSQRSLVYARAKNEESERPFGTQLDVYEAATSSSPTRRARRRPPTRRVSASRSAATSARSRIQRRSSTSRR